MIQVNLYSTVGFLLKIIFVTLIVVGVASFFVLRKDNLNIPLGSPRDVSFLLRQAAAKISPGNLKNVDLSAVGQNISSVLDSIVTHPNKNSPVVLGVKITEDSLNTLVDVVQNMPPEQAAQIRSVICAPPSSPSATP